MQCKLTFLWTKPDCGGFHTRFIQLSDENTNLRVVKS